MAIHYSAAFETTILNRLDYLSVFHRNFLVPRALWALAQTVSGAALGIVGIVAKLFDHHTTFDTGQTLFKHGVANIVRVKAGNRLSGFALLFYDMITHARYTYKDEPKAGYRSVWGRNAPLPWLSSAV